MKPKSLRLLLPTIALCITPATLHAAPLAAYDGVHLDSGGKTVLDSFDSALSRKTAQLYSTTGGIYLATDVEESQPGNIDGGINLYGNPVSITLARRDVSGTFHTNAPLFAIRESETWSSVDPIFQVNGATRASTFSDSDVAVNNGSLKVDGNNVLTAPTLGSALNGLTTVPSSSAWTAAYVPRGTVSNGAFMALGTSTASGTNSLAGGSSVASGLGSFAFGQGNTASGALATAFGRNVTAGGSYSLAVGDGVSASGQYSIASGANSTASGFFSFAHGTTANAEGLHSVAFGQFSKARTAYEIVLGRYNTESAAAPTTWNEEDALFRLGNGNNTTRADAITTLKNGRTTLINKAWETAVTADPDNALDDPAATTDSGGEALVVRGHTRLDGRVVISVPQGDISMGIYGE